MTATGTIAPTVADPMLPVPHRVVDRVVETPDSVTLRLLPVGEALPTPQPGQFMMLYAFGVGEIAISVAGVPTADRPLEHTVRRVGAVSAALHGTERGGVIGVRGPYGHGWDLGSARADVVIVAGGVGLAPLRPLVHAAIERGARGRVVVVAGARAPRELLYAAEQQRWARSGRVELLQTVDVGSPGWAAEVGFVTEPLGRLVLDPARTTAFVCGPEPMMRFCAQALQRKALPPEAIRVSIERNMRCGVGLCGHCQLGELIVCLDGPVVSWQRAEPLLAVREL